MFAERLAQALDLPAPLAAEVLAAAGPTSRRSQGVVPFDWDEAVLRMAGSITTTARSTEAYGTGKFEGFRFNAAGPHQDWAIPVDAPGTAIYSMARGGRAEPHLDQRPGEGMFGRRLQAAGLLAGGAGGDPDPVVLRTLRRLDGRALGLLRTVRLRNGGLPQPDRLRPVASQAGVELGRGNGLSRRLLRLGPDLTRLARATLPASTSVVRRRRALPAGSAPRRRPQAVGAAAGCSLRS